MNDFLSKEIENIFNENYYGVIYCLVCRINGKKYIGQTVNFKKRLKDHLSNKNTNCKKISRAINKYGKENFLFAPLIFCYSQEELNFFEIHYTKKFNTIKNGYNIRLGGKGGRLNEDTKRKIGLANKGEKNGMYGKPSYNKGKSYSKETLLKMRLAKLGKPSKKKDFTVSRETRQKISNSLMGEKHFRWAKVDLNIIKKLYDAGKTNQEISTELSIRREVVSKRLRILGLPDRIKKYKNDIDIKGIIGMFKTGKTKTLIAECFGISRTRVRKILQKHGIK